MPHTPPVIQHDSTGKLNAPNHAPKKKATMYVHSTPVATPMATATAYLSKMGSRRDASPNFPLVSAITPANGKVQIRKGRISFAPKSLLKVASPLATNAEVLKQITAVVRSGFRRYCVK
jgi:hypothetical protein